MCYFSYHIYMYFVLEFNVCQAIFGLGVRQNSGLFSVILPQWRSQGFSTGGAKARKGGGGEIFEKLCIKIAFFAH